MSTVETPVTAVSELTARRPQDPPYAATPPAPGEVTQTYRLRDLRELCDITQVQVAGILGVSQNRVSAIERGDVNKTQVDTLRRYFAALGGTLTLTVEIGNERFTLADRIRPSADGDGLPRDGELARHGEALARDA